MYKYRIECFDETGIFKKKTDPMIVMINATTHRLAIDKAIHITDRKFYVITKIEEVSCI